MTREEGRASIIQEAGTSCGRGKVGTLFILLLRSHIHYPLLSTPLIADTDHLSSGSQYRWHGAEQDRGPVCVLGMAGGAGGRGCERAR